MTLSCLLLYWRPDMCAVRPTTTYYCIVCRCIPQVGRSRVGKECTLKCDATSNSEPMQLQFASKCFSQIYFAHSAPRRSRERYKILQDWSLILQSIVFPSLSLGHILFPLKPCCSPHLSPSSLLLQSRLFPSPRLASRYTPDASPTSASASEATWAMTLQW